MIMQDPSFLIHGVRIMEIGHLSFYPSFWAAYVSREVFDSGSEPMYLGMDRI